MNIYFALEDVPELSDLSKSQKRAVLFYYSNVQRVIYARRSFRYFERGLIGLIILAEVAGLVGGFVYWHTLFWGPLAGALIAMALALIGSYFIYIYLMIPKFRRFLHSEEAESFIRLLKKPKEANAA
jgi:hypothetical protein